jgi:hypothetical protein
MKPSIQKRKWTTDFDDGWEDSQIFEHRVATTLVQSRWLIEVAPFDGNTKDCALILFFLSVLYTY